MADPAAEPASSGSHAPASPPTRPLDELCVAVVQLPRVHGALARALGEAGVGGAELLGLFDTGVHGVCVGCGISVTGAELGELAIGSDATGEQPLHQRLERLRLGFCPRNGCDARFFNVGITQPGSIDRALVLGRTKQLMSQEYSPVDRNPNGSSATRRALLRLSLVTMGTLLCSFIAYRLIFFSSQPIPFVEPKSPYSIAPASLDPHQR